MFSPKFLNHAPPLPEKNACPHGPGFHHENGEVHRTSHNKNQAHISQALTARHSASHGKETARFRASVRDFLLYVCFILFVEVGQ